jgi:agmatinase
LNASHQVDLYDLDVLRPYEAGLHMLPESEQVRDWNERARSEALKVIEAGGQVKGDSALERSLAQVNELGAKLNGWVYSETKRILNSGKIAGLVGGDHSVPLGALQAIGEKHPGYGILHFDAHSDTRDAYEGFTFSHASIMRNVLERVPEMKKLVQVGIRDLCEEEVSYTHAQGTRVQVFYDRDLQRRKLEGTPWGGLAREIMASLPQEVWISFDIDGLDPRLCPNTGTPVAGGLEFHEALYVISLLVRSGRKIIGFDLNEVAPDPRGENEWDANVGARLLYKLAGWTLASQSKAKLL